MIDALNLGGPPEPELIYVDEPRELAYWAQVLDVPDAELRQIVNRVGPRAIDVRRHLTRVRHAERQRKAHRPPHVVQLDHAPEPRSDLGFVLLVCCAAAAATAFGALAYSMAPSDERTASQGRHGCEAVAANGDPALEQLRCAAERTLGRAKLANAGDDRATQPMR